jgi:hypothetical protein
MAQKHMTTDIKVGYRVGFDRNGQWTIGTVIAVADTDSLAPVLTVKLDDSDETVDVPATEAGPPY